MGASATARAAGLAAMIGGVLGLLLAPAMVIVKYQTGWSVIPKPAWIGVVEPALESVFTFATPVRLWVIYGSICSVALVLMFAGLIAFVSRLGRERPGARPWGWWIMIVGLALVIPGDLVHTLTWHQDGLTVPTPGTNPLANTAYAVHMMGMNFVLIGSLWAGISALRRGDRPRWLGIALLLIAPGAVLLSLTLLPTSPSGGLWMFSVMIVLIGCRLILDPRFASATPSSISSASSAPPR